MSTERSTQVSLSAEQAAALADAVTAGEYGSIDEALADALETWSRRKEDRAEELAWMRAKIGASLHDPRPTLSLDEVDAHLEAFFRNVENSKADEGA